MTLRILSVAYPFAPVRSDSVGGAEQILSLLDRALVEAGHLSHVIACEGSQTAGQLHAIPAVDGEIDDRAREIAHARCRRMIARVVEAERIDLVHLHGIDFAHYAPERTPALATLHLPPEWYDARVWSLPPNVHLHCVSQSQHARAARPRLLPPIENGAPQLARADVRRREFCLALTRICPEKGVHLAIEAAKRADAALLIAGQVYPYRAHQDYFATHVAPRLDERRRFIGPVRGRVKARLLSAARALLAPYSAPETSSLVAMEALGAGTPVIAFPSGALADIVEHGRTGFLVEDVDAMAAAIRDARRIDPALCRETARKRFSLPRMVAAYLDAYSRIVTEARA